MPVAREVRCLVCSKEGADVAACDTRDDCSLVSLPPKYVIGDRVSVRHLKNVYTVESIDLSRGALGAHRYHLSRIKDNKGPGGKAREESATAYAADLTLLPAAVPAPELSLAPDPQPAAAVQDATQPGPATDAAAVAERAPGDAIRSPATPADAAPGTDAAEGPGEEDGPWAEGWESRRNRKKEVRYAPSVSMSYRQLKNIVYSGSFPEMEGRLNSDLEENTPVGVVVTKEANGAAVWVIVCDGDEIKDARQEVFYPTEREPSDTRAENMAIEYGVLLALRKIPIRTNDLEIVLLGLS